MGQHSRRKPNRVRLLNQKTGWKKPVLGTVVATTLVLSGVNAISLTDQELAKVRPSVSSVIAQQGHQALPPYVDLNPVEPSDPDTPLTVADSGGTPTLGGPEKDAPRPSQGALISPVPDPLSEVPVEDQEAAEDDSGPSEPADEPPPAPPADTDAPEFVDLNCDDFNSQEEAQAKLEENEDDIHDLDRDNDGLACEVTFSSSGQAPPAAAADDATAVTSDRKCTTIGVKQNVIDACNRIVANFPEIKTIYGFGGRPRNPTSCHPRALALDFMTGTGPGSKSLGDRITSFVRQNKESLEATTILWQVPAHYDHVHVSFLPCRN